MCSDRNGWWEPCNVLVGWKYDLRLDDVSSDVIYQRIQYKVWL